MNHRFPYCKQEDAAMQELRQQLKKSNVEGKINLSKVTAPFDRVTASKTSEDNNSQFNHKTESNSKEMGLRFGPFIDDKLRQQSDVRSTSLLDQHNLTDTHDADHIRPISRNSVDGLPSIDNSRDEDFPTPGKDDTHAERSDDDLDFSDKTLKSTACESPSTCSSPDSMNSAPITSPNRFLSKSNALAITTSNDLKLH